MNPRKGRHSGTDHPGAAGRAGRGLFSPEARETTLQAIKGLFTVCLIILAAILGFLFVELLRAIF